MGKAGIKAILAQILLTTACVAANVFGGRFAVNLSLPLWLDSVGTILAAYVWGPLSGILVGAGSNIISSLLFDSHMIYAVTSIALALVTGFAARKKPLNSFFGAMCLATALTAATLLISIPLNLRAAGGQTSNVWGDAVISYLAERGAGRFRFFVGQYYTEFVDKTVSVLLIFFARRLYLAAKKHRPLVKKTAAAAMLLFLTLSVFAAGAPVFAAPASGEDTDRETPSYSSYTRTVYNGTNGLPSGEANAIETTADGMLWVGTYAGLYRYDGRSFIHMDDFETVKNVNCLYTDEEGRLWIGTNDSGLAIAINEEVVNTLTETENGLPSDSVRSIGGGQNGIFYVGTGNGLVLVSLTGGLRIAQIFSDISDVTDIATDASGHAACVTGDGRLVLLDGNVFCNEIPEGNFSSVCFRSDGVLLAGTADGKVSSYTIAGRDLLLRETIETQGLTAINGLYPQEESGEIFVCADDGIGYFDTGGTFSLISTGTFTNSVEAMAEDYQGNLWFASSRLGLLRLASSGVEDLFQRAGIAEAVVNTVARFQGDLYCGTDTGLVILDEKANAEKQTPLTAALAGLRIRSLYARGDALWIATDGKGTAKAGADGQLTFYDGDAGAFGKKSRVVIGVKDGVAAGGNGGLTIFRNDGSLTTIPFEEGAARVLCLSETADGTILAGTDGDGIAVIENGAVSRYITKKDGLSSDIILKVPVDGEDVYAVTSNGLCFLNGLESITYLSHFPYSNNYDIAFLDGKAYVSGSAGIYVANVGRLKENAKDMVTGLLDAGWGFTEGLTANAWNFIDNAGRYYLSSNRGVYCFDTGADDGNSRTYRIHIPRVFIDGMPYTLENGSAFSLPRETGKLNIRPEIINFSVRNPYVRFRMDGLEDDYTEVPMSELSEVTYTGLSSGNYTFRLQVLASDRTSILEQVSTTFVREPALYDSRGFFIYFYGIAGVSIAWFTWLIVRTQLSQTLKVQMKQVEMARDQVRMSNETIVTIARALDARDPNTSKHSERVAEYAVKIAEKMGLPSEECENLRKAALVHDIGKVGIPDAILNKTVRLTDDEYDIMKTHVAKGAEILKNFTGIDHVVDAALYHHERYDGHGYANGLKGEDIPLYGRIIGVADAFDGMMTRVRRGQVDVEYVLEELVRNSGTQFDPEIADIMISLVINNEVDVDEKEADVSEGGNVDGRAADSPEGKDFGGKASGNGGEET